MSQGFYIQVHNKLLETKHYLAMRESVWLFMWCLDRITIIDEKGIGWVLGKKPIKFEDVKENIEVSKRNYNRWIVRLRKGSYILTIRTPYGLIIGINKAKKTFKKKKERYATNGTSNTPHPAHLSDKNGVSKYNGLDQSVDITERQRVPSFLERVKAGEHPTYDGMQMRFSKGRIWCIPKDGGSWLEFAGAEKDIVWK